MVRCLFVCLFVYEFCFVLEQPSVLDVRCEWNARVIPPSFCACCHVWRICFVRSLAITYVHGMTLLDELVVTEEHDITSKGGLSQAGVRLRDRVFAFVCVRVLVEARFPHARAIVNATLTVFYLDSAQHIVFQSFFGLLVSAAARRHPPNKSTKRPLSLPTHPHAHARTRTHARTHTHTHTHTHSKSQHSKQATNPKNQKKK